MDQKSKAEAFGALHTGAQILILPNASALLFWSISSPRSGLETRGSALSFCDNCPARGFRTSTRFAQARETL